jgi:uncharacterized protein (TIRG00374 family)
MEVIPTSFGAIGTGTTVAYFLVIMGWTVFFGYATLFRPDLIQRVVDRVFRLPGLRRFRSRVAREMGQLRRRARILRAQPPSFFLNGFLLTLGTWMARYLLLVFIVWSVYPALDAVLVFMRHAALILSSLILPTPGGSGGIEGLYFAFLGPPLMPKALVVPTLVTWRVLGYYLFLGIGVFLTTHHVQKTIRRRKMKATPAPNEDSARPTTPLRSEPEPVALNDGR